MGLTEVLITIRFFFNREKKINKWEGKIKLESNDDTFAFKLRSSQSKDGRWKDIL